MRIGELNRRVQLQRNTPTADGLGQERPSWSTIGTYWAKIEEMRGWELSNARQMKSLASHKITMRCTGTTNPVTPTHRLLYADPHLGDRDFNLIQVLDVAEARREYSIIAEEIVPAR